MERVEIVEDGGREWKRARARRDVVGSSGGRADGGGVAEDKDEEVEVTGWSAFGHGGRDFGAGVPSGVPSRGAGRVPFQLTRGEGVPERENAGATGIRDALQDVEWDRGLLGNFMVDLPWLMREVPRLRTAAQVVLAHGGADRCVLEQPPELSGGAIELIDMGSEVPPFGSHHCKFAVLFSETSVRVVIHTANYIPVDWGRKTQGAYIRDFPLRASSVSSSASSSSFGSDLEGFLMDAYGHHLGARELAGKLRRYDFSGAGAALVASVPGNHPRGSSAYGHRRLRALMRGRVAGRAEVVAQCSSLGSLQAEWLDGELTASLLGRPAEGGGETLKLVWPTRDDVEGSLEGVAAGNSIPLRRANCKPFLVEEYMHRWTAPTHLVPSSPSTAPVRQRAMPHIKSYAVVERHVSADPERDLLHAFVLTSANVSKAAWGWPLKSGQLKILSYELGVLFLPEHHLPRRVTFRPGPVGNTQEAGADAVIRFPVPYSLRPTRYVPHRDVPWVVDEQE